MASWPSWRSVGASSPCRCCSTLLAAYALANLAAFGVVVTLRGRAAREDYRGLAARHPWLALALVVSFLSFVGIPPLAGFAAKLALFGAAIDAGYTWLAGLAVANTVVSMAYYGRVLGPAYFDAASIRTGAAATQGTVQQFAVLGVWAAAGVAICAAALLVLGIWANGLLDAVRLARVLPG